MDDDPRESNVPDEATATAETADGIVSIRGALVGLGFIWLTAVATFGALAATVYGVTTSIPYLLVAVLAAVVAVYAGSASLRAFGYR